MNPIFDIDDINSSRIDDHSKAIIDLRERVKELEYQVYRLSEKFPDINRKQCAGCKYLTYGMRVGVGEAGRLEEMCTVGPRLKAVDSVNGCSEWRKRGQK